MVNLEKIREVMVAQLEEDKSRVFVEVSGVTLEDALSGASIQLGISVRKINYEVLQKGTNSFFSLNKKEWIIRAYEMHKKSSKNDQQISDQQSDSGNMDFTPLVENRNGNVYVFCASDGVYLKVVPPMGNGIPASLKDAMDKLRDRNIMTINEEILKPVIKAAKAEYVKVGMYKHNPANDSMMSVNITDQDMKAFLYASPPGEGGADLSVDMIVTFLKNNRIAAGIDEKRIQDFQDNPVYKQDYLVAQGIKPQDGADAKIVYNFETDRSKVKLKESASGKVDFKDLNLVQNVVEGQPLAQKVMAERGKGGKNGYRKIS